MKLMGDGVVLLVLGQIVVFSFLATMVLVVKATSFLVARLIPHTPPAPAAPDPHATEPGAGDAGDIAAAIAAAIHRFRNRS